MELFCKYFIYFLVYAFLGWLMEVALGLIQNKKLVNRGFLIGPICPIYGIGFLIILFFIGNNKTDFLAVFLKCILICSILEYFTSYIMEKLFKIRWWDYSKEFGNINGRICVTTMIPFGIIATLVIYYVHPLLVKYVDLLNYNFLFVLVIILIFLILVDTILSTHILMKIKEKIKFEKKDSTENVRKQIEKWLKKNKSSLYERIISSFPRFQIYIDKVKKRKKL